MKLLFCPDCGDVVQLRAQTRHCACRQTSGRYLNDEDVEIQGDRAEVLGINGHSLRDALTALNIRPIPKSPVDAWLLHRGANRVRRTP